MHVEKDGAVETKKISISGSHESEHFGWIIVAIVAIVSGDPYHPSYQKSSHPGC